MEHYVLAVDREIEQHNRKDHLEPRRQGQDVEHAPALGFGAQGHTQGRCRKEQPDHDGIDHHHTEVGGPAPEAADILLPARSHKFPRCHEREHAGEGAEANDGFNGKHSVHAVIEFSTWRLVA